MLRVPSPEEEDRRRAVRERKALRNKRIRHVNRIKSGNPRLRATLVQLAWLWVRHQPTSALTAWFKARVAQNGGRQKKSAIVALARKLLVALWKYISAGIIIEGAVAGT
jgi:transposase